ncbi:hypothetical protein [Pseudolabrys sp. Root1462]|jgi:ABC-type transporter Mla maintaining outer membrane lipid asymmetry ATPase subunit MlaF|uniref:hypothetical protein n=1 Tax=Pseudolabrys sp. Root1462 TaxID=1736466 RepID=UPI0012E36389|nr:hypothetical protein [Pseudolabrys sp. Root1462]
MTIKPYPKYLARQNRAMVHDLLMREWDPIGVRDVPQAQDEYDAYVSKAYVMVMHDGASIEQVADYLYTIETEYMGLGKSAEAKDRARKVAVSLIAMKPRFAGQ